MTLKAGITTNGTCQKSRRVDASDLTGITLFLMSLYSSSQTHDTICVYPLCELMLCDGASCLSFGTSFIEYLSLGADSSTKARGNH